MYRLEWTLNKQRQHTVTYSWDEILSHPMFITGTVFEFTPIGWCAL